MIRTIYKFFKLIGLDFYTLYLSFRGVPFYIKDILSFKKLDNLKTEFPIKKYLPILSDRYDQAGNGRGHYFYQDLLVAQKIFRSNPIKHVDIGSRLDGFVAHVASYRTIEVMDIRKLENTIANVEFVQKDFMVNDPVYNDYCDSLSCLHALEHFGLGRYGDTIDPSGHLKGFENIYVMLQANGKLYFSVPIGQQRIEFNAHRVFSINYIIKSLFNNRFDLLSFSYVDDNGNLFTDVELTEENIINNFNCNYGCGIFELIKK